MDASYLFYAELGCKKGKPTMVNTNFHKTSKWGPIHTTLGKVYIPNKKLTQNYIAFCPSAFYDILSRIHFGNYFPNN